ncbi:uncharacterized protein LOC128579493 [Nycticebus coucang]|uniref:uncharacterized protein LOC128579493 n=1 Tax=Nycticebus coucang TaxID=9470 RepID=UPI00234C6EDE|nr:uncharacterized protein LOC128579493 [Nycticebus coucang]
MALYKFGDGLLTEKCRLASRDSDGHGYCTVKPEPTHHISCLDRTFLPILPLAALAPVFSAWLVRGFNSRMFPHLLGPPRPPSWLPDLCLPRETFKLAWKPCGPADRRVSWLGGGGCHVLPAHMRSGAKARSPRSRRGARDTGRGFSGPDWGVRHPAKTCCAFRGRKWRSLKTRAARDRARHAGARDAAAIVACGLSGCWGCAAAGPGDRSIDRLQITPASPTAFQSTHLIYFPSPLEPRIAAATLDIVSL